jgi:hypothetical protein
LYLKNEFEGDLELKVHLLKTSWIPKTSSHYETILFGLECILTSTTEMEISVE